MSIDKLQELTKHTEGTAALTGQIVSTVAEQASKKVRFAGHGGQIGHGGQVGCGGRVGAQGGIGKGGIGALEQRKLEERDGVGGIETGIASGGRGGFNGETGEVLGRESVHPSLCRF